MQNNIMYYGESASETFYSATMGGGGTSVHCTCGIDHVAMGGFDEDEEHPVEDDNTKTHDADCVSYITLDGQIFSTDCKTCMIKLKRYENFIWNHRGMIREYLSARIAHEKEFFDQEELLNKIIKG